MAWYISIRLTLMTFALLFVPVLISTLLLCGLVAVARQLYRWFKRRKDYL